MPRFFSFFSPEPTPPEPFGFKTGWIAVRTTDFKAVADSLPIRSQAAANWHDGIEASQKGGSIFITPPINGWICVVGDWAVGTARASTTVAAAAWMMGCGEGDRLQSWSKTNQGELLRQTKPAQRWTTISR
jgi:hypothetical protein